MRNKLIALLIIAMCSMTSLSYATIGVKKNDTTIATVQTVGTNAEQATDINIKGVPQMYTDGSTITIDETSLAATGGTVDGVFIGSSSPSTVQFLSPVQLITNAGAAATGGTVSAVTLAKSGFTYVLTTPASGQAYPGGVGMTLSLPSTNSTVNGSFSGQTYTFITATGSTLSIRTASSTDATIYYGYNNCTRITSPASSGSTVTVVGYGGSWYIAHMNSGAVSGSTYGNWTPGNA